MRTNLLLLVLLLLTVPCLKSTLAPVAAENGPAVPGGVLAGYEGLARSMRAEAMVEFMAAFSLEYVHVDPDGRSSDRGPWRRLWLDNFRGFDYPLVTVAIGQVRENEADRVVLEATIVEVTRARGEDALRVREYLVEDIWSLEEEGWKLVYREEKTKSGESRVTRAARSPARGAAA